MSDIVPHGLERGRRAGKEAEEQEERAGRRGKKSLGERKRIGVDVRPEGAKLEAGKIRGTEKSDRRENVKGAS